MRWHFIFILCGPFVAWRRREQKKKESTLQLEKKKPSVKCHQVFSCWEIFRRRKKNAYKLKGKIYNWRTLCKNLTRLYNVHFQIYGPFLLQKKKKKIIFSPPRKISIWQWRISEYNFYTNHHNWKWLAINMEYFIELRKESINIWHQRKNFFLKWKFRFCFKSSKFSDLWTR